MNQAIVIQGEGEGQDFEGDVQYMSVDAFTEGRGSYSEALWNFHYKVIDFIYMHSCLYLFFSLY